MAISRRALLLGSPLLLGSEHSNLLEFRDGSGRPHPVRSATDWKKRESSIRAAMEQVMGPLPRLDPKPPRVSVIEEQPSTLYIRQRITYTAEDGDEVPAFLLLPKSRQGSRPAMLCLHQTVKIGKAEPAGLGGNANLHYAHELAERGYVALAPDYPNFGDYRLNVYDRGYASATMKGIVNHMRAVDLLVAMPGVDKKRIGVIGHSLGGHNSLFVAAFDARIGAVVTSCGFTAFHRYYGGNLTGWSHNGYMPRIATEYGKSPDRVPFDFPEVLASLAPRRIFISAPLHDANFDVTGVRECVDAASQVYAKVFHKPEHLSAYYPDCAHDFPCESRDRAYAFLDSWAARPVGSGVCAPTAR